MRTPLRLTSFWTLAITLGACDTDFAPPSLVTNARILATQASPAYARPGETVSVKTLAVDGRAKRPAPLRVTAFPTPCVNPEGDDVARCYPALAGAFSFQTDLTPMLAAGDSFSFEMPADAVSSHEEARGGPPYGLAYVFVAACAGHLERIETSSPDTPPFGCFDDAHRQLGPNDYVFAFARITASDALRNENPVIDAVIVNGAPIDEAKGVTVAHCVKSSIDDCPTFELDVSVPPASQEPDPVASTEESPARETLWIDSYVSAGKVEHDRIVLYDGLAGKTEDTRNTLYVPRDVGEFTVWAVVRDNRGGVAWRTVPLHVQ